MDDIQRHAIEHRVRFDECDAGGVMRPSALLRIVQDLAWRHSEVTGYDRAWYAGHGLTWLVRFVDLAVTEPLTYGDALSLTTRVTGWRRVWCRRRTTIQRMDGGSDHGPGHVAGATIDWVLIDALGRPTRVPPGIAERFTDGAPTFTPGRVTFEAPAGRTSSTWDVRNRDLDPMAHVNNATYLDVIDEVLAASTGVLTGPQPPVRYEVEYLRPALPGSRVDILRGDDDGGASFAFRDPTGAELLRATVTTGPVPRE